jgi:hypothetical protein
MDTELEFESNSSSIADSGFDNSYPIPPPRRRKQQENLEKESDPVRTEKKLEKNEKRLKNFLKSLPSAAAEKIRSGFWNLVCINCSLRRFLISCEFNEKFKF